MRKRFFFLLAAMMLFVAAGTQRLLAQELIIHFYIPSQIEFIPGGGCAMHWAFGSEADGVVSLVPESGHSNWYTATVPNTEYKETSITLLNAPTLSEATETLSHSWSLTTGDYYFLVNKDLKGDFFLTYADQSWAIEGRDCYPYDLGITQREDTLFLSWKIDDGAVSTCYVMVYDKDDNELLSEYIYDLENPYVLLSNAEEMDIRWAVYPNVHYTLNNALTAYSAPFKAAPSPKVATNLKAKENSDGTFTFTWDAPKSDKVKSYTLIVDDPMNYTILDEYNLKGTSITTKMNAMYSGSYTMKVYSNDENLNTIGLNTALFDVAEVAEHDINIRIMINPVSSYDTFSGVQFEIQDKSGSYSTVDAVKEKYGWWSYKLTTKERGTRVRVSGDWSQYDVFDDICLEYTGDLWLSECDARATDYQPHDFAVDANEDGTYTISWLMDATERVGYYTVSLHDPKSTQVLYEQVNAQQVTTPVLSEPGFYNFYMGVYEVRPMEYGSYSVRIGSAAESFEVKEKAARDITLRVLVQPGNSMWEAATYNELEYDYTTPVAFVQEGSTAWYSYTFKDVKDPAVNVKFFHEYDYSGTLFAVNEDMCVEFDNNLFTKVACDKVAQDFTITNLKREDKGNGKMNFSWECADDPSTFGLYIVDSKDNVLKYEEVYGSNRSAEVNLAFDSAMAVVNWYVIPAKTYGMGDKKADGETFSLPASPFVPQNIKAAMDANHRWNITWDAISGVSTYQVELSDWGWGYYAYETKYNAGFLSIGDHTVTVTAMSQNYEKLGSKSLKFTVSELPERDMIVRLLLHKDANISAPEDLQYEKSSGDYQYVAATEEGGNWYEYSFKTTVPAPRISIFGFATNIGSDTCFEYVRYLSEAPCDAVAHDYRIKDGSLKATSLPGRVIFSWEAEEVSDRYYVELLKWDDEGGYWRYVGSINADKVTECTYMVPDNQDGLEIKWTVSPQSPHYLTDVEAKDKVTLQKSKIVISDLKAESTNDVDYHFSWKESTKADVNFEVEVIAARTGCVVYTKKTSETSCEYTFLSGAEEYRWRVRALDKVTADPLTTWEEAKDLIEVPASLRIINNLKATVSGRTITFSWDKIDMPVAARLQCTSKGKGMSLMLDDKLLTTNSYSFEAVEDGRYDFRIVPVVEIFSETSFSYIDENATTSVNIFKNKTYKVELSATTGGYFDVDMSGDYEAGFELDLRVWPEAGYRFISWSDGYEYRMRSIEVKGDIKLVALFEPIPMYDVTVMATAGGEIRINSEKTVARLDTTLEDGDGLYIEAIVKEGHTFTGWSDGYNKDYTGRYINIRQDTVVTANFKPICYAAVTAGAGGRVQVTGADKYDKENKKYACIYGSELIIKAVPDEDYRFVEWSDGNKSVSRSFSIITDVTLSAKFEAIVDPISQYIIRILTNDTELGAVSQLSGTYFAGDKLTITAEPKECAKFIKWSDGNTDATRTITVSSDLTITAQFELKRPVLTLLAGVGGSVNSELNGTYDYGTFVLITATPAEHYQFVQWSDGETMMTRNIELTEDTTLTAQFVKEQYLISFINEDGTLLESNKYSFGETPVCSVEPKLTIPGYICVFKEWSPAITTVSANAVYTAVFTKTPTDPSAIEQVINSEENASKVLINGQIFILRGDRIYTVQGMLVK